MSVERSAPPWPPLTTAWAQPRATSASPCRSISPRVVASPVPVSSAASAMFGVATVASGSKRVRTASTTSSSAGIPSRPARHGSATIGAAQHSASARATASTSAAVPSTPVLTAAMSSSAKARRTSPATIAGARLAPAGPAMAVGTVAPWTRSAAKARRSAAMPPAPCGSTAPIVSTTGIMASPRTICAPGPRPGPPGMARRRAQVKPACACRSAPCIPAAEAP